MAGDTLRSRLEGKRFGLVLSAGFFGFYGHAGFVQGLVEAGLLPSAYAGSSAGGLVGALAATGMKALEISRRIAALNRASFWDPDPLGALLAVARGGHATTGLLRGDRFRALLDDALPVKTFEACPHPLILVATNLTAHRTEAFASGELAPRILATCAYPGMFRAVCIGGSLYWDGGLVDKAPILALADSEVGATLDAILVHYLPSRRRDRISGALAYAQGLDVALSISRSDHVELQLEVMKARGTPVYLVSSELTAVSPTQMSRGVEALAEGRLSVDAALALPPRRHLRTPSG